ERLFTGDEVEMHDGQKILVPNGMSYDRVMRILTRIRDDAETVATIDRQFFYRPDDGAHATYQVLRKRYGSVIGEKMQIPSFFGSIEGPAETRTISIGVGQRLQIPWGYIGIPTLDGVTMF